MSCTYINLVIQLAHLLIHWYLSNNSSLCFIIMLQVVAESELQELPISSDDDDDADRTDEAAPSHMPVGSVIAVFEVDPYLACPINSCSNKKLVTVLQNQLYVMRCSKCNGTFRASTAKTYLRVVVSS